MSSLSKLRKGKKNTKGAPPSLDAAPGNTQKPPRTQRAEPDPESLPQDLETKGHFTRPSGEGVDWSVVPGSPAARQLEEQRAAAKAEKTEKIAANTPSRTAASEQPAEQDKEPTQALQLKVPLSVYNAFSEAAAKEFGYKKGNKTLMFLKLWNDSQDAP